MAAARSEVAPSTMKSAGHDTAARNPPTAGPTLIPRFTASRWRAKAALRWSGAARCEMTLRLAGRNISPVSAMRSVRPAIAGSPRASGTRRRRPPDATSAKRMSRTAPSVSARRPATGAMASEPAPKSAKTTPAAPAVKPRWLVR